MLLYTSGTVGRPKGVRLSHRNVAFDIEACLKVIEGVDSSLVMAQLLPLFHTFALTATLGVPTCVGGSMVAVKRFSPEPVLDAIEKYGVTHLIAIPSMYRVLNRSQTLKPRDTKSLRVAVSGGEPLAAEVRDRFREIFGLPITEGYGLTETSPVVSVNPLGKNKPGSVGPPLPGIEVAIRTDEGKDLPTGEVGEICVKGPTVMMGYQNRPADTSVVLAADGWLSTGDMGRVDEDGYIWITGRKISARRKRPSRATRRGSRTAESRPKAAVRMRLRPGESSRAAPPAGCHCGALCFCLSVAPAVLPVTTAEDMRPRAGSCVEDMGTPHRPGRGCRVRGHQEATGQVSLPQGTFGIPEHSIHLER
jgi:acyl-CoA synthetase (AMP-forming)/AMP-acid ligase II